MPRFFGISICQMVQRSQCHLNPSSLGIYGALRRAIGDRLLDEVGLVSAQIDLEQTLIGQLMHEITGRYNQPAILSLHLDARMEWALQDLGGEQEDAEAPGGSEE